MKLDLGYTPSYYLDTPKPAEDEKKDPPVLYPSLSIEGEVAKKLLRKFESGDKFTATIEVTVTATQEHTNAKGKPNYGPDEGCRIELEVGSVEIEGSDDSEEDKPKTAEEAVDGYFEVSRRKRKRTDGGGDTDNDHDD